MPKVSVDVAHFSTDAEPPVPQAAAARVKPPVAVSDAQTVPDPWSPPKDGRPFTSNESAAEVDVAKVLSDDVAMKNESPELKKVHEFFPAPAESASCARVDDETVSCHRGDVVPIPTAPVFWMVKTVDDVARVVDDAIRNDESADANPIVHAKSSRPSWIGASCFMVDVGSPIMVWPVLSTENKVDVAEDVEEAIAKSVLFTSVSFANAWTDSFAYGVVEPTPRRSLV
jgi:hypothetical protein